MIHPADRQWQIRSGQSTMQFCALAWRCNDLPETVDGWYWECHAGSHGPHHKDWNPHHPHNLRLGSVLSQYQFVHIPAKFSKILQFCKFSKYVHVSLVRIFIQKYAVVGGGWPLSTDVNTLRTWMTQKGPMSRLTTWLQPRPPQVQRMKWKRGWGIEGPWAESSGRRQPGWGGGRHKRSCSSLEIRV